MNIDAIKVGEQYKNINTGKMVTVVESVRYKYVRIKHHDSGRVTKKQDHYFAYDYEPAPHG